MLNEDAHLATQPAQVTESGDLNLASQAMGKVFFLVLTVRCQASAISAVLWAAQGSVFVQSESHQQTSSLPK